VPKLLLADDSPTTQKVVQLTFADEGVDVVVADDGDTALELFDHHRPDIVLADINIPGLNGYEVCDAIRKRDSAGSTPVILLAGSFEPFDVEEAHRVGANDYLTKPFSSIRRLVATVTAMLDSVHRSDGAVEETIEPVAETAAEVIQAEQPVAGPPPPVEPDMLSTADIENLYSQSISDQGVSEPHVHYQSEHTHNDATAQHAVEEVKDSVPEGLDPAAFDDGLIETTYLGSDTSMQNAQVPSSPIAFDSSAEIPVPLEVLESSDDVPQSQIPTVSFGSESFARNNEAIVTETAVNDAAGGSSNDAEIKEFQLDQSGEETFFEPAPETSDQTSEGHQHEIVPETTPDKAEVNVAEATDQSMHELVNVPGSVDLTRSDESAQLAESRSVNRSVADDPQSGSNDIPEDRPDQSEMPWDAVAEPQPQEFRLDGSDLLELPAEMNGGPIPSAESLDDHVRTSGIIERLTPELVDRIAKATADQVSEALIREVAWRVVPKVIEEVIGQRLDPDLREDN
jgi:CheY-like chemotaxis protein